MKDNSLRQAIQKNMQKVALILFCFACQTISNHWNQVEKLPEQYNRFVVYFKEDEMSNYKKNVKKKRLQERTSLSYCLLIFFHFHPQPTEKKHYKQNQSLFI